jgi:hypothetical protein
MVKLIAVMSLAAVVALGGYVAAGAADPATNPAAKAPAKMSTVAAQVPSTAVGQHATAVSQGAARRPAAVSPLDRSRASAGVQELRALASSPTCGTSTAPPGAMSPSCAAP